MDSYQITNMSFSIRIATITNFNINITFSYNVKAFTLMKINYLIGNRNDLSLGFLQQSVNNN